MDIHAALSGYFQYWHLAADGEAFKTHASILQPVRWRDKPAMLKFALSEDEIRGNHTMAALGGVVTADVYAIAGHALLMARSEDPDRLKRMSAGDQDEQACRILCRMALALHRWSGRLPQQTVPLSHYFQSLLTLDTLQHSALVTARKTALALLADPAPAVLLHGDLHHGNLLWFGVQKGWQLIDPKGITGSPAFDFAALFANPQENPDIQIANFNRRVKWAGEEAQLSEKTLKEWIAAQQALSAAWFMEEGMKKQAEHALHLVELALS